MKEENETFYMAAHQISELQNVSNFLLKISRVCLINSLVFCNIGSDWKGFWTENWLRNELHILILKINTSYTKQINLLGMAFSRLPLVLIAFDSLWPIMNLKTNSSWSLEEILIVSFNLFFPWFDLCAN